MELQPGTPLLHYELIEKIGAGGMGEVYRATDTKLGRDVAIKVLPKEMASDTGRLQRFRAEAKAVAALNHPGIVTIHSVEEVYGVHFLTMELVDGQPLGGLQPKNGFPLAKLFELAIPIVDAIAAAHEKGITHRDLKPANVMVSGDGRVKILDFGLAKLQPLAVPGDDDPTRMITQEGLVVGTVPYMSPEQLQGRPVDPRTDIYSLGAIFYEMATGQRPFSGDSSASLISAILRDAPRPLVELNSELPNHLGRVIHRCLEKNPEQRYQSAKDLRNELSGLKAEVASGVARPAQVSGVIPTATPPGASRSGEHPMPSGMGHVSGTGNISQTVSAASGSDPSLSSAGAAAVAAAPDSSQLPAATGSRRGRRLFVAFIVTLGIILGFVLAWRALSLSGKEAEAPDARTPAATAGRSKLVVLPLENLGSPDDDYFAAGMTDELTSRLSAVPELAVISRKSAMQYAKTEKSMQQICAELGVDYVVEGSVRWARSADGGSRVRITPQLIDVAADTTVWSGVFDRELDDIFEIQSDIAERVVRELGATFGRGVAAVADRPTENLDAYQAFLRANYHFDAQSLTPKVVEQAIASYEQATELDPQFSEAWARLSESQSFMYHLGYDVSDARRQSANRALERAAEIAPEAGQTYLARGYYLYWGFKEYDKAQEQFRRAMELLPNNADAMAGRAYVLRRQARFQEAVDILHQIVELNPRFARLRFDIGETLTSMGEYDAALEQFDLSLALQPHDNVAGAAKSWVLWQGRGAEGLREARAALDTASIDRSQGFFRFHWFWQLVFEGRFEDAHAYLEQLKDEPWVRLPDHSYPQSLLSGIALELAGRTDEARSQFESAAALLASEIARTPDDFRLFGPQGIALAALGRSDEAVASAERGAAMIPLEKDSLLGPPRLWELALTHVRLGNLDAAIDQLETVFEFSGLYSPKFVELDPQWEPLREHPRYAQLIAAGR